MAVSMAFIFCSFIFITMIAFVYFLKGRVLTTETRIYNGIIIFSIISLILEFILCLNIYVNVSLYSFYNLFINRFFLISLYSWFTIFTLYLLNICFNNRLIFNKFKKIIKIVSFVIILLLISLPIELVNENGVAYSTGVVTYLLYVICIIYSIIWGYLIIRYRKKIGYKKCYPFIAFILCFGIILFIRAVEPAILLNSFSVAFPTALMFFTIENPDVKMVSVLNENRILVEKNNEAKSNLLFKISQEVKKPISDIASYNNKINGSNDIEFIRENCKLIDLKTRELMMISDGLLDISKMDSKNIKIDNGAYNVYNFFKEIKHRTDSYITNKNIDFRFNMSSVVPEYLYGDSVKLKQVVSSIISNSIKYTKKGFIELDIDSIVKYDTCRLIITISDSGLGMTLDKINTILSSLGELSNDELKRLDSLDVDLVVINKLVKMLNGTLIIKSEVNVGSQFMIVIDQRIVSNNNKNSFVDNYINTIVNKKRVLVIDDDIRTLNEVSNILEIKDYEVIKSSYGKDLLDRINNKEKIDLIIIDDENIDNSALNILKDFKNSFEVSIPILVMLNKDKLFISKHYIDDGFTDYIVKDNLDKELDKVDKYI